MTAEEGIFDIQLHASATASNSRLLSTSPFFQEFINESVAQDNTQEQTIRFGLSRLNRWGGTYDVETFGAHVDSTRSDALSARHAPGTAGRRCAMPSTLPSFSSSHPTPPEKLRLDRHQQPHCHRPKQPVRVRARFRRAGHRRNVPGTAGILGPSCSAARTWRYGASSGPWRSNSWIRSASRWPSATLAPIEVTASRNRNSPRGRTHPRGRECAAGRRKTGSSAS